MYGKTPLNIFKDMVPIQKKLAIEHEWCYPCNRQHNKATCSNTIINQMLKV